MTEEPYLLMSTIDSLSSSPIFYRKMEITNQKLTLHDTLKKLKKMVWCPGIYANFLIRIFWKKLDKNFLEEAMMNVLEEEVGFLESEEKLC